MRRTFPGLVVFHLNHAGSDDLGCLAHAERSRVNLERLASIPDAFERANFFFEQMRGWL